MTPVFLTIDTEFAWRHHAAGLPLAEIAARSLEPAGVGLAYQLAVLARHGLKATFFVDPGPVKVYGDRWLRGVVSAILAARQEVQLHLHPNWWGADADDRSAHGAFELIDLSAEAQRAMLSEAAGMLVAAGAPAPVAFRAGSYSANDDTLAALAAIGVRYDSSHNGAHAPWPSAIPLPAAQVAPVARRGLVEVPVSLVADGAGLRNLQLCALSAAETRAALDGAAVGEHAAAVVVGHSFELANRAGTAANAVHVRRFEALCAHLAARRDVLPTAHFADLPALALGRTDRPVATGAVRRRLRQAEQLWSNLVAERAA